MNMTNASTNPFGVRDRSRESLLWLRGSLEDALFVAQEAAYFCPEYGIDTLVIRHLTTASEAVALMIENERFRDE